MSAPTTRTTQGPEVQELLPGMTPAPTANTPTVLPVRLLIPSIAVNAAVEQVGILANGDLNTPQLHPLEDVGWDEAGPVPGQHGSAVIDGHLDGPGAEPGVFWFLNKVAAGDEVLVEMSSGTTLHFRVTRTAAYPPADAPLQAIFADSSGAYLNLITCAGDWAPSQQQMTLRRVIYTTLE